MCLLMLVRARGQSTDKRGHNRRAIDGPHLDIYRPAVAIVAIIVWTAVNFVIIVL